MLNITIDPVWPPWFSTRHLLLTGRSQVYDFAFDRLRSVRQDMIIQRTAGPESRAVLERTVRLLAYASFRLCGEPLRLYDPRINDTHLQESLSWLLRCCRSSCSRACSDRKQLSPLRTLSLMDDSDSIRLPAPPAPPALLTLLLRRIAVLLTLSRAPGGPPPPPGLAIWGFSTGVTLI
jgi:hypothetical protein